MQMKIKKLLVILASLLIFLPLANQATTNVYAKHITSVQKQNLQKQQEEEEKEKKEAENNRAKSGKTGGSGKNDSSSKHTTEDGTSEDDDKNADGSDNDYAKLNLPARAATAFWDAIDDAYGTADTSGTDGGNSGKNDDKVNTLKKNIKTILDAGNFYNVGVLYGPLGKKDGGTDSVSTKMAADKPWMKNMLVDSGNHQYGQAYYAFGKAFADTVNKASKTNPSGAQETSDVASGMRSASARVAGLGVKILKYFSPAPVALAFYDSRKLSQAGSDNLFVNMVVAVPLARNIIQFFGNPAPAPFSSVSNMTMIAAVIIFADLGISAFLLLFGNHIMSKWVRRAGLKCILVFAGIPLVLKIYDAGLDIVKDFSDQQIQNADSSAISEHLGLASWANARFALPVGVQLTTKDGAFYWDEETVRKINLNSAMINGVISSSEAQHPDKKTIKKVVNDYFSLGNSSNVSSFTWSPALDVNGDPYHTDKYNSVVQALGQNQAIGDLEDSDKNKINLHTIGYFNGTYNYNTSGDSDYVFYCTAPRGTVAGFSPIAAQNFLSTDFSNGKISVRDNMNTPTLPTVAVAAPSYTMMGGKPTKEQLNHVHMASFTSFILNTIGIVYALIGIAKIISSGFGGILSGAGGTALGRAESFGRLAGAIIAIIGGILGMSLLNVLILQGLDALFGILRDNLFGTVGDLAGLGGLVKGLNDGVGNFLPPVGWMIKSMLTGIWTFFLNIIMIIIGSSLIKIPLAAFTQFMSGLPDIFAGRAANMENRLLSGYNGAGAPKASFGKGMGSAALGDMAAGAGAALGGAKTMLGGLSSMLSRTDSSNTDKSNKEQNNKSDAKAKSDVKNGDNKSIVDKKDGDSKSIDGSTNTDKENNEDKQVDQDKENNDHESQDELQDTETSAPEEVGSEAAMSDNPEASDDPETGGGAEPSETDNPASGDNPDSQASMDNPVDTPPEPSQEPSDSIDNSNNLEQSTDLGDQSGDNVNSDESMTSDDDTSIENSENGDPATGGDQKDASMNPGQTGNKNPGQTGNKSGQAGKAGAHTTVNSNNANNSMSNNTDASNTKNDARSTSQTHAESHVTDQSKQDSMSKQDSQTKQEGSRTQQGNKVEGNTSNTTGGNVSNSNQSDSSMSQSSQDAVSESQNFAQMVAGKAQDGSIASGIMKAGQAIKSAPSTAMNKIKNAPENLKNAAVDALTAQRTGINKDNATQTAKGFAQMVMGATGLNRPNTANPQAAGQGTGPSQAVGQGQGQTVQNNNYNNQTTENTTVNRAATSATTPNTAPSQTVQNNNYNNQKTVNKTINEQTAQPTSQPTQIQTPTSNAPVQNAQTETHFNTSVDVSQNFTKKISGNDKN